MTHTRSVYHTVHDGSGDPWPDFTVHFQLTPAVYQMHASLPESVVTAVTDNAGQFAVTLETGIQYRVLMYSAFQQSGSIQRYGDKNIIDIVVPHGTEPISLDSVLALNTAPDPDPDLAALANNHIGRTDNPHVVTAAQLADLDTEISASPDVAANTAARHTHSNKSTLDATTASYTTAEQNKLSSVAAGATANATDAELRDRATHTGAQAIGTVTGLQAALDAKATASALTSHTSDTANPHAVTAAQTGAYTTAQVDNALALRQPLDSDLTAISALVAANDDVIQRKSGAWTNRTPVQLKSDLALSKSDVGLSSVTNDAQVVKPAMPGAWYQVLRQGVSAPEWVDPSGPTPLLIATPQGSADRNGPIAVTPSASVEVRDGAWWLCEGTTNESVNPRAESTVYPPWVAQGANTLERDTTAGVSASTSFKMATTAGSATQGIVSRFDAPVISGVSVGDRVALSFAAKAAAPMTVKERYSERRTDYSSAGDHWYSPTLSLPTEWQRFERTYSTIRPEVQNLGWYLATDVPQAGTLWVTDIQAERKPYVTPFVVGTRVDGTLSIPHTGKPDSILVRYREDGLVYNRRVILDGNGKGWFGRDNVGQIEYASNTLMVKTTSIDLGYARQIEVLGVATYDVVIPDYGLILTPQVWTMGNLPLVYAPPYPVLPVAPWQLFTPTHQTASGTTDLRVAPDDNAQSIKAMSASTSLQVSSVIEGSYTRVNTTVGEGWVLTSQIISL